MRPFSYDQLPGRVVFGRGTLAGLSDELERLDAHRVALISDDMAKSDSDRIESDLGDQVVARIGEIRPHVPVEDVESARRLIDDLAVDTVVTIGGGSTTGLGKAIALERDIRFLAIPTTYAGSEMTPIYGMTGGDVKRTGRDPRVKPLTVIYDVDLTLDLPAEVTAGSTMNALAHCVEALYAEERNPITTFQAMEGVKALNDGSRAVASSPRDEEGRAQLLLGAFLAGSSLGAVGMAIHHRICHVLGGTFGLAHGDANAVVLPYVVAYNREAEPEVMSALASALLSDDAGLALYELARALGAPSSLSELGMRVGDIERAADMVVERGGYNPRPIEREWVGRLLGEAFLGRRPVTQ